MAQTYVAYHFTIKPVQPATEILIAQMGALGFESFVENENGFSAYISKPDWHPGILNTLNFLHDSDAIIVYDREEIAPENWNETWESNFEPIEIDNTVSIRAPFHEKGKLIYNILIEPKMSFGTGHHETTHMMIQQLLSMDIKGKKVLDMGTGTGVLAIMSDLLGAQHIDAIDIDQWSYENALENVQRNRSSNIAVYQGDATWLQEKNYDVILANINKNILLQDISTYNLCLSKGGTLILSGFYSEDIADFSKVCKKLGYQEMSSIQRNNWVSIKYKKPQ
jgi:ribosomal protein L11 methyltransferase